MNELVLEINSVENKNLDSFLKLKPLNVLYNLKFYLDDLYYNQDIKKDKIIILKDEKYDILKENIIKRDSKFKDSVGSKIINKNNKVNLPIWMGSMNKIKPEEENKLSNWLKTNNHSKFVIEKKIDGVSCLLVNKNKKMKIFTRGDGYIGNDISKFLNKFDSIPQNIEKDIIIRGELVMYNDIFQRKFSKDYANSRNFVSGRINGKKAREGIKDITFIAYEIIDENEQFQNKPSEQIKYLKSLNFLTVDNILADKISTQNLTEIFLSYKNDNTYQIDGLIIQPDKKYIRNINNNPKYAFAYKMLLKNNLIKTEVENVIWNVSKWGQIKPKIKIKQIKIDGNVINFTTGFNAKYIYENNIGKGAIIYITRSGDVIPYIVKIEKEADKPDMPNIPYKWNETKVDIISIHFNKTSIIKLCLSFFNKLNIKYIGQKCLEKMFDVLITKKDMSNNKILIENKDINIPELYIVFLVKIISSDRETLLKVKGFKELTVKRILENIKNGLENVSLSLFLGASGIFGYGIAEKKIKNLLLNFPSIFSEYKNINNEKLLERIVKIDGFSVITAKNIIRNIKIASEFIETIKPYVKFTDKKLNNNSLLKNLKIVFSGFRDYKLEEKIWELGGEIMSDVTRNISLLIVIDKTKESNKLKKAKKFNIDIISKENFINKFL
jgi:DNA ligase (NAD+)